MASDYEFVNNSGVVFELVYDKKTETESIQITIPTYLLKAPTKPTALREERVKGKATGWYNVPKSDSFVAETKKLKSGHSIMLQIYKRLPDEVKHQLYQDGTAKGLKVHPVDLAKEVEERLDNPSEVEETRIVRTKL